jgi:phenylalanyl-tRNA synthetase beta chain
MRQSLVGSLLDVVETNRRHGRDDVAIFEVGKGYAKADGGGTREWWRLGLALTGAADTPSWNRQARPYDLDDAKGLIELVCRRLGYREPTYAPLVDDPNQHPGRTAHVRVPARSGSTGSSDESNDIVGRVGEVHPGLLAQLGMAGPVIVAELAVSGLAGGSLDAPLGATPSRHPAVERDLAVVVTEATPAAAVRAAIERHGGDLLGTVELFDIYGGRPLADGEKSLAWRLRFQAADRTLTEDEIDAAIEAVTKGLAADVGGRIRT